MSFDFNRRYALFTYAQCGDLDPFEVVNHLAELGAECIIGREAHADGGTHLHAFVDFGRKFRTRRADAFDVGNRHPNISPSYGTPEKGYDYAIKDGDVVGGGSRDLAELQFQKMVMSGLKLSWQRVETSFCSVAFTCSTSFALLLPLLVKYADWKYRVDPEPYRHDPQLCFDLSGTPELLDWSHDTFNSSRGVGTLS